MKKILSISIFLIICTLGHSQETNKEQLKNAETELSAALEKEDYEKAASLKKEIVMRKEIEEAVKNGNYEKASNYPHYSLRSIYFISCKGETEYSLHFCR